MVSVGINGFGRIGRLIARKVMRSKDLRLSQVNDIYSKDIMLHLLKHDSIYKNFTPPYQFRLSNQPDIKKIDWTDTDVVIEASGIYTKKEELGFHLKNGAKKVILTAYNKELPAYIVGVNEKRYGGEKIISASSCTGNCTIEVMDIIDRYFGIKSAHITTIHSYTTDQNLLDNKNKDPRRARGAAANIIPLHSNVANAIIQFLPHLKNRLHSTSIRVPTQNGVLIDINLKLKQKVEVEFLKESLKKSVHKKTISFSSLPLVSSDITKSTYSAIIDESLITIQDGDFLKLMLWQDNETWYVNRVLDILRTLN